MHAPDLRFALRSLSRARGFAITVILTLGLGIGANTAIFSVVRGVLLKPLPHRDGDRLVYLRQSINGPGGENIRFSVPEVLDFRSAAKAMEGIAEYSGVVLTLQGERDAVRMQVGLVTGNYFQVMGLSSVLGRVLNDRDDGTGVPPVVVLTHEYWHKRFGGDSAIVGKSVRIDGRAVEVVGVLQPAPTFPERMDALMNMVISEHHTSAMMVHGRTHRMTDMIARLAPTATLEQARNEVATVRTRVTAEFPEAYDAGSGYKVTVTPFVDVLGERARLTLWLLMGAAAFVMIISAANVANLSLMRGVRREHELVVRAALGAGTARLRRLLLVENLLLAFAGAVLGLVIAVGGVRLLAAFAARYSPRANEIRIDGTVLAFALLLTVVVAVIISFAPTLAAEGKLGALIAAGASRVSGGMARQRLQRSLVVAQVAVSVILLTGAGLLTRTMMQLSEVQSGLTAEDVLTMEVPISGGGRSDADTKAMYARMREEIRGIPGVREVGLGSTMPLRSTQFQLDVKGEGHTLAAGEPQPRAEFRTADPDFFRAAGIPLLKGREFTSTDRDSSQRVVVINQTLANQLFQGRDAVGRRVAWTGEVLKFIGVSGDWRTVVGVVGDTKDGGLDADPRGVVFAPFTQEFAYAGGLVIRGARDAPSLAGAATRVVRNIAPQDPIENVLTVAQIRDESVAPRRLNAALISALGMLAVVIAAVGIAGVLAFSVSARTNEIGIRMSLGADRGMVQRMILMEGGVLLAAGITLGVVGAALLSRLIRGLLFGVAPYDPLTLSAVGLSMIAVGVAACWIPAARAARIEPVVAMRGH
ncbi:MAG: ABC transporter permease [Gemmatimonadetes bacterium]|nr:ABC transporter permease [Gemmatimonadota bacterium]